MFIRLRGAWGIFHTQLTNSMTNKSLQCSLGLIFILSKDLMKARGSIKARIALCTTIPVKQIINAASIEDSSLTCDLVHGAVVKLNMYSHSLQPF